MHKHLKRHENSIFIYINQVTEKEAARQAIYPTPDATVRNGARQPRKESGLSGMLSHDRARHHKPSGGKAYFRQQIIAFYTPQNIFIDTIHILHLPSDTHSRTPCQGIWASTDTPNSERRIAKLGSLCSCTTSAKSCGLRIQKRIPSDCNSTQAFEFSIRLI